MESISRRVAFLREAEAGGTRAPGHVEGELGGLISVVRAERVKMVGEREQRGSIREYESIKRAEESIE